MNTVERWALLKSLFQQALSVDNDDRSAFVRHAAAGDASLERSLSGLLKHHDSTATGLANMPMLSPDRMAEIVASGLRTFVPGELIAGRFLIQRFIAEGGMGEVYAAEDLELNEPVALKTIRPVLANNDTVLARFRQEIQLARKVTHHNVARVYDLFRHHVDSQGQMRLIVFLSMELLEGETLSDRIYRLGPMRPEKAEPIAAQLAAGLDAAHNAGIIHRDFKSSNVALVPDAEGEGERAVIVDFGLAAKRSRLASEGSIGFTGTPAYMSPEQVESKPLTPASDIYALGVVMFEMLTGTVPFRADTPEATARLRLSTDAPLLRSLAPDAPLQWENTVQACLTRDPMARPKSGSEVADRLTGRFERRTRLRWLAAAAGLAVLLAGAIYWIRRPHQPTPEALQAADTARVKLETVTPQGFREAALQFQQATELDPKWAQAWAELAYTYAAASNSAAIPAATALPRARAAAIEAIRLDDRSAKAFGALGWVQSLDLDEWPNAEANLRRALNLNPDDGQVHYWLGVHLRKMGKFSDAEAEVRQALALTHQKDSLVWFELGFLYWTWGRQERFEQHMKEYLTAYPNFGPARFQNVRLLKEQGRFDDAMKELDFCERLQFPAVTALVERASIEAFRGRPVESRRYLGQIQTLAKSQPVDSLLASGVYAKLGDFDQAFQLLDQAFERRDSTLLSVPTSPLLAPLRGDPRYKALLERLHFPQS